MVWCGTQDLPLTGANALSHVYEFIEQGGVLVAIPSVTDIA